MYFLRELSRYPRIGTFGSILRIHRKTLVCATPHAFGCKVKEFKATSFLSVGGVVACGIGAYGFSAFQSPQKKLPRPAPGPGEHISKETLRARWKIEPKSNVLCFFMENEEWGEFSNFYNKGGGFEFVIPQEFFAVCPKTEEARTVKCDFSEKAIMLCKAAAMGDASTFDKISKATDPMEAKLLGRQVKDFDPTLWDRIICSVAYEVVLQKFEKQSGLLDILFKTEDRIIAETSEDDTIWGIGMRNDDPRVNDPAQWQGTNILGWALMEARKTLRTR